MLDGGAEKVAGDGVSPRIRENVREGESVTGGMLERCLIEALARALAARIDSEEDIEDAFESFWGVSAAVL